MAYFDLDVVNAATKASYPKYIDASGNRWVCGEPGKEFFIRVFVFPQAQGKTEGPYYRLSVKVDGRHLGYDCIADTTDDKFHAAIFGIPKGDVSINAFKFERHDLSSSSKNADDAMDGRPGQGNIQLTVYKVHRLAKFEDTSSLIPREWDAASAPSTRGNKKDSSVLSAGKGKSTQSQAAKSKYDYSEGVQVEVQTLNYTTEFGLAVRGMHTPVVPLSSTDTESKADEKEEAETEEKKEAETEEKKEAKTEEKETKTEEEVSKKRKRDDDSNGGTMGTAIDLDED